MVATMHRRLLLIALACWPAARAFAQDGARPRHKISAAELHAALSERFPLQLGFGGLLALRISAPSLHLLPARNRIGAGLVAEVSGPPLQQVAPGEVDVLFTVRYEASDKTIRARDPELAGLRWPGLPPEAVQSLQKMLPSMAREALDEVVLHSFTPAELSLPDTMGFEPDQVTVVDDGLVVSFAPKRRR
jgi:hypothetical protein